MDLVSLEEELYHWIALGVAQSESGAFHAWRDPSTGKLSYEYPEITGYALTCLSDLQAARGELTSTVVERAAMWLTNRVLNGTLTARPQDGDSVYVFDLAMVATGLLLTGTRLAKQEVMQAGKQIVHDLVSQILSNRHLAALYPGYPRPDRITTWSTDGSAHMLKIVQCLLLAKNEIPQSEEAAAKVIKIASDIQMDTGRLVTNPGDLITSLHPLLYGVEGLWIWGKAQGHNQAVERATAGLTWAWKFQLDTGGFPGFVDHNADRIVGLEQSDVTCQAIRLAVLLGFSPKGLDAALARLVQISRYDTFGMALPYQPGSTEHHLNVWSTIFGAQAVAVARGGSDRLPWTLLA